jgi:hypothetical protein
MMNKIRTSRFVRYTLALLLLFVAMASSATAKHKLETPDDSVTVVVHLPPPGTSVSQNFPPGTRQQAIIQQASEDGFTLVDVAKPHRPNVVNRVKLPKDGGA